MKILAFPLLHLLCEDSQDFPTGSRCKLQFYWLAADPTIWKAHQWMKSNKKQEAEVKSKNFIDLQQIHFRFKCETKTIQLLGIKN